MNRVLARGLAIVVAVGVSGVIGAGTALASPWRYYDTFSGPNPWYSCAQRGNQGINEGTWWDYDCRGQSYGVDLYIQVNPN